MSVHAHALRMRECDMRMCMHAYATVDEKASSHRVATRRNTSRHIRMHMRLFMRLYLHVHACKRAIRVCLCGGMWQRACTCVRMPLRRRYMRGSVRRRACVCACASAPAYLRLRVDARVMGMRVCVYAGK
jgi:hypothetical protein